MATGHFNRNTRELEFVLFEYLDINRLLAYDAFSQFDIDDFKMVIEEANKIAREILSPAMKTGDREGCHYQSGKVHVPGEFHKCWETLTEGGWLALTKNPEFGGQGFPLPVGELIFELFLGANPASMSPQGLAVGNGNLIETFGSETDRELFVNKMFEGKWGGTMCLTESDAGSDVGWIRTRAIPDPQSDDPRIYKIKGTKQFITMGEHDLTENIIHLILARIEGGPKGTKGVSLFIVPKIWVNPDGSLGEANDVVCSGIEHKMGLKGSSTCTLNFGENDNCKGILLGEPHSGISKMFQQMNEARIQTAVMALATAAGAYDCALNYAKERVQGPPFSNRKGDRACLIKHEDIRRMLMNLKSGTEGMRAMIAKVFFLLEVGRNDPDDQIKLKARKQAELFTPMVKTYCSDFGYVLIRDAIQILGGAGYCSDFPVEQYARDSKINSIWEGTSYIQSIDLVSRKLKIDEGAIFDEWIKDLIKFTNNNQNKMFADDFKMLNEAADMALSIQKKISEYESTAEISLVPLFSTRFLEICAEILMAQVLLEQGILADEKMKKIPENSKDFLFYTGKIASAQHFFCRNILTNIFARFKSFELKDKSALELYEDAF